jgi:adenylosuccinate synthase
MIACAVIGSLYGDEGKGLMTDFFAAQAKKFNVGCTVVRSNGGAQAGHTVVTPEGVRHVFHHFGSGTLAGASTHLSKFMIVNPIMFNREWDALVALGVEPVVTVSPDCLVTFPQDMLMNQMLETMRGGDRHGSCGMGVGETAARRENGLMDEASYNFKDLLHAPTYFFIMEEGIERYVDKRLADLDLTFDELPEKYRGFLKSPAIWKSFWKDCATMLSRVSILEDHAVDISNQIIFEGAQGLALDRDMGFFPYVTRSKTGLFNVTKLCKEMGITELQVTYAMRSYTSRHGAGPLDGENADMSLFSIVDETNHPNDWQGTIRAAPLDLWLVNRMTSLDVMAATKPGLTITKTIALTCLDQAPDVVPVFGVNRFHQSILREKLFDEACEAVGATDGWISRGPTRDHVDRVQDQLWMT